MNERADSVKSGLFGGFCMGKRFFLIIAIIVAAVLLGGCGGGGDVENVEVPAWEPSALYTDADIEAAVDTIITYFAQKMDGFILVELDYPGDSFQGWDGPDEEDETIVLHCTVQTGSSVPENVNPNSTYRWSWVLVRKPGGRWEELTHGFQ